MDIDKLIQSIEDLGYEVKYLVEKTKEGKMVEFDKEDKIKSVYNFLGIEKLYEFQKKVMDCIDKEKNVVISAPTASGKTEAFLYAALKAAFEGKKSLLIYPTKALSRDQLKRFYYLPIYGITLDIYDGDTPQGKRKKIRDNPPSLLITNFDMLHFILLNHKKFEKLFRNLEYVIIDEFHIYTGVFGSHVGNIIRRLKRLMKKAYGKEVKFVVSSATVKNAKEFAESIVEEKFELVKGEGKSKKIHHLIVKPLDSYLSATIRIASLLDKKTLIFANSHGSVERLGIIARNSGLDLWVYRAGLSKKYREELEKKFKSSKNAIIASTSALELGIDIGSIEAVIMAGFAGKISSAKQRLGRAGRKGEGIAVFIARESPLDIYYAEHPELYIFKEAESCYANPSNPYILKPHLLAMAKENLLREEEVKGNEKLVEELVERKLLTKFGKFYSITKEGAIAVRKLSIRGVGENISIVDMEREEVIGQREKSLAISELFEGAIYLHGGKFFISKKLNLDEGKAYVVRYAGEENIYTKALVERNAEVLEEYANRKMGDLSLNMGRVRITTEVYGFLVKDVFSNSTIGEHSFETPYIAEMESNALWLDFEEIPSVGNFGDALHGFEHVSIAMSPLLTGSDEKELGGISYSNGRMYIYEGIPGGVGLVDVLYKRFEELSLHTKNRLYECDCEDGCPKCIFDPMCGNDNRYLSKEGAKKLSSYILENIKKGEGSKTIV